MLYLINLIINITYIYISLVIIIIVRINKMQGME